MAKKKTKKKVKKVKTEPKVKAKPKARLKAARKDGRRKVALILSIIAIAILIANSIYYFVARETIISGMHQTLSELPAETLGETNVDEVKDLLPAIINTMAVVWLVLAALTTLTICLLRRGKGRWYALLILGIIVFLNLNWWFLLAGILLIVSSILYRK